MVAFAGWPVLLFMPSFSGSIVVAGITVVGVLEFIGSLKMQRGLLAAPSLLACNQTMFILLIAAYCIYQMLTFSPEQMYSSPEVRDQMAQMDYMVGNLQHSLETMIPLAYYAFYCLVMFLVAICQGALAIYYLTRRKHIDRFNRETPDWVKSIIAEVES